jgi:hypothetical protein
MEPRPSSEAASCAATMEIPNILSKPKVHYRVHKRPQESLSWARWIQSISLNPIPLRSILSSHLYLGVPGNLFSSEFPNKILYTVVFYHVCYISFPSLPPCLGEMDKIETPHYANFM